MAKHSAKFLANRTPNIPTKDLHHNHGRIKSPQRIKNYNIISSLLGATLLRKEKGVSLGLSCMALLCLVNPYQSSQSLLLNQEVWGDHIDRRMHLLHGNVTFRRIMERCHRVIYMHGFITSPSPIMSIEDDLAGGTQGLHEGINSSVMIIRQA